MHDWAFADVISVHVSLRYHLLNHVASPGQHVRHARPKATRHGTETPPSPDLLESF
jgi:hypothetical protein